MLFSMNIPDAIATRMPLQITEWPSMSSAHLVTECSFKAHLGLFAHRAVQEDFLGNVPANPKATSL